eukprot:scaffold44335_cov20-Prasinocladus_malaysianus.AAC.1
MKWASCGPWHALCILADSYRSSRTKIPVWKCGDMINGPSSVQGDVLYEYCDAGSRCQLSPANCDGGNYCHRGGNLFCFVMKLVRTSAYTT